MRLRPNVLGLSILVVLLVTTEGYPAPLPCVDTSVGFSYRCVTNDCDETVYRKKCLKDNTRNLECDGCAVYQVCCEANVCSASRAGDCDSNIGGILSFLRIQADDPADLSSFYALDCQGEFVPVKDMLRHANSSSSLGAVTAPTK